MTQVWQGIVPSIVFTALGLGLLAVGFVVVDWLTPGDLRRQVWIERNRNAAIYLSSALIGLGAIIVTAIMTTYTGFAVGIVSTTVYGLLGLLLMAATFWVVDVLTPGRLGDLIVDPNPHGAVWVSAAINIAVAGIVCASIA